MNNNIPNIPLTGHLLSQTMDGYITGAKYIDGTYIVVKTLAERDDLTNASIYEEKVLAVGTPAYVSDDKKLYRWNGSTWDEEKIDFSEIENQLQTLDNKITNTDAKVLLNTQTIDAINDSLNERATIEYVDETKQNLSDSVSAVEQSVNTVNNKVTNLETSKLDKSTYNQEKETFATKSQVTTDINKLKQDLDSNGYATDAELSNLSTVVDQKLANKASSNDVTTLRNDLITLGNTVSGNKTAADNAHIQLQNDINTNESAIQANLAQIQSTITNIETIQTVLKEHSDEYEVKVDTNVEDIETLKSTVSGLQTNAATKTQLQEGLAGKLDTDTYNTDKETFATKTELDDKAAKSTTLDGYGITDAYTKTETDTKLSTKANVSSVTSLQTTVNNKADKTTVNTLSNKVTNLENNKLDKVLYQNPTIVATALGGIQVGTNLQGMTIQEILTKIFEVALVNITLDPNNPTTITIGEQATFKVIADPEGFDLTSISWQANPSAYLQFVNGDDDGIDCIIKVLDNAPDGHIFTLTATYGQFSITTGNITCVAPEILTKSEEIIKNQQSMYVTDLNGNLVSVPWSMIDISESNINSDITESGFYQVKDASGNIIQQGYQSVLPIYQEGPLTIALPNTLSLSDIDLYQYDGLQSKWSQVSSNFLQPRSTQDISGYTIYEDPNNASQGEHFRFAIKN